MRGVSYFIIAACALSFSSGALSASELQQDRFLFSSSDVADELSHPAVSGLLQDSTGLVWILTEEGLNRYDGKQNVVYRADRNDEDSLSSDSLFGVVEDPSGQLWFATGGGGLNRFNPTNNAFSTFRRSDDLLRSPYSNDLRSIAAAGSSGLWMGYNTGGVSYFDLATETFRHYLPKSGQPGYGVPVTRILELDTGDLLISTLGQGVLRLNKPESTFSRASIGFGSTDRFESSAVLSTLLSRDGSLWVGTRSSGLFRFNDGEVEVFEEVISPSANESIPLLDVFDILETRNGDILVAQSVGIARLDSSSNDFFNIPMERDRDRSLSISTLLEDSSGLIWAGGFSGIYVGFRSGIQTYNLSTGISDENILSVLPIDGNHLLLGSLSGVELLERNGNAYLVSKEYLADLDNQPVTSLLRDGDSLWLGTLRSGLLRVGVPTSERSKALVTSVDSAMVKERVSTLFKDSYGNLWVGTLNGGVSVRYAGSSSFRSFALDDESLEASNSNYVSVIFQERSGVLWVGTSNGLLRFSYETETFKAFKMDRSLPSGLSAKQVFSIYEDDKARLWIGTGGGGLNMWEPVDRKMSRNKFKHFQSNIGLPSNNVYAIQGDDDGNVWLATSGGLTRFNYDLNEVKHFTVDDGLQSNDFNLGASYRDENGLLYFGGTSGLNVFDPAEMRKPATPPRVALTRVTLGSEQVWFDKPYSELDFIELEPDDYLLGLSFAALDFRAPHRNQYRYQMVGLDKNWVDLGNRNSIDFTKLPMGEYVLRIQGSNPDGVWSPDGIAMKILVHPPFYLAWYSFIAYFAAGLLLIAALLYRQRLKVREQLQLQSQLEDDVRSRTLDLRRSNEKLQDAVEAMGKARQEAEHANQAKSEFLAALSHEIRTPMHGVLGMTDLLLHSGLSDRQQNFAESAHVSANELLGLIDNILDFSKIEAGKLELEETSFGLREMVENLCYLYGELAQTKGLELNVVINADLRRQLYGDPVRLRQILQNLLSNAIKFTRRGGVTLTVKEVARQDKQLNLEFVVEDTGIGMAEDTVNRVFEAFSQADTSTTRQFGGTGLGLSIAKQLIDLMGGELLVNSRQGVGTTMAVKVGFSESPIYVEQPVTRELHDSYGEVIAELPETRQMFSSQLEALGLRVRECDRIEELSANAEQPRIVLIDVGSLSDAVSVAQVENLSQDTLTTLLLVTPLSGSGIPDALTHIDHTTKPMRLNALLSDVLAAQSDSADEELGSQPSLMRFERRILLVEDIAANQEIAKAMLESFGCQVAIARHGEIALEMFQQENFDLVLMDCQMPVMDGFAATRHIRRYESQQGDGRRVPVVALTAGKTETEKERCYASGMDRILFKPYSTEQLNGLLHYYFEATGSVVPVQPEVNRRREVSDLLDAKALDNIRNIETNTGNALLEIVVQNFRVDGERKLEELREAIGDATSLSAGAHAIKSMSLNVGAKALSDHCRRCEAAWKRNDVSNAERDISILAGHFEEAVVALESLLSSEQTPADKTD